MSQQIQQLIEDNTKLVYAVVHKHYPTFAKDEDIIQSGNVGLCLAANTWIEEKGKFSTYAYRCIRNEINREFRRRCKEPQTLSLDYEVSGDDGSTTTFGDLLTGESDVGYLDDVRVCRALNSNELQVYELVKQGLTPQRIAHVTHLNIESVRKHLRKIKKLLEKEVSI